MVNKKVKFLNQTYVGSNFSTTTIWYLSKLFYLSKFWFLKLVKWLVRKYGLSYRKRLNHEVYIKCCYNVWIIGSRFIHFIRADSNVFLFMAE